MDGTTSAVAADASEVSLGRVRRAQSPHTRDARKRVIVSLSPFRCRVWELHDRLDDYLTEESCRDEIESFKAHGQLIPALGRPVCADPNYDIEIICGVRRLFVARHLGLQLLVEVRDMSDQEALVAMDVENRHRKDVSPYERGRTYQRWLRLKHFSSQDDIAHMLNISASQVSRLLKLAQLPSVIVNAFPSPLELREGWALELHKAWMDDEMRPLLTQRARTLAALSPRVNAPEVYRRLLSPAGTSRAILIRQRDEVVRAADGTPLYRIRRRQRAVAFLVDASVVSPERLKSIRRALAEILQRGDP